MASTKTIAIVEDEDAIRNNYTDLLTRRGYQVQCFADRASAWDALQKQLPDLVIIDVQLGAEYEGGFDLCRDLRLRSVTLPIIFLTARSSDFDTISGLRLGADDYLTKDISLEHLAARVAALFRRQDAIAATREQASDFVRGELTINKETMRAAWTNQAIDLTVTEFWILYSLTEHPGHIRSRDQLMEAASVVVDDNTITSHIKRIRKKIQQIDGEFDGIETVYGAGYRWKI